MGLFDRTKDRVEDATGVDLDEDHAMGNGFDREVCRGCPYEGRVMGGSTEGCEMCGCPFFSLARVGGGSPPSGCPRLADHAERGGK